MRTRKRPLTPLAAAVAGMAAGAVGTVSMDAVRYVRYRHAGGKDSPLAWEFGPVDSWEKVPDPGQIGKRLIEGFTQRELPDRWAWLTSTVMHWGYGLASGALYGVLAGSARTPRALEVKAETDVAGLRMLPTTSDEVPQRGHRFALDRPVGCVIAVRVSGTSYERMAERARAVAEHGLRLLRIALRESRGIHDDQLRFALGEAYAFDDRLSGWARRPGAATPLGLAASDVDLVRVEPSQHCRRFLATSLSGKRTWLCDGWNKHGWPPTR